MPGQGGRERGDLRGGVGVGLPFPIPTVVALIMSIIIDEHA